MKILEAVFLSTEVFKTLGFLRTVELDAGRLIAGLDDEGRDPEEAGWRIVLEEMASKSWKRGPSRPK